MTQVDGGEPAVEAGLVGGFSCFRAPVNGHLYKFTAGRFESTVTNSLGEVPLDELVSKVEEVQVVERHAVAVTTEHDEASVVEHACVAVARRGPPTRRLAVQHFLLTWTAEADLCGVGVA